MIKFPEMKMNLDDNDDMLISMVKKFAYLYDKRHPQFKDCVAKDNAWAAIAYNLKKSAEECVQRFTVLRRRYNLERKIGPTSNWPYLHRMSFLDEHITPRRTTTRHFKTKEDASVDPNVAELMMKVEDDTTINDNITPIQSPSAALPYLYHQQEMPYMRRNESVSEEGAAFTENKMQEPPDDAAEAVGKAVAALIREIKNKRKRNETIAEIFQLFAKYKSEDEDC